MRPGLLQRLDTKLRHAVPGLLTLAFVILSVAPLRVPDYALIAPGLVLIALFYWTVHRPDLLHPWHACVLGLFDDILSGTPIGINGLVLTLVHWAVTSQHTFFRGKSFAVIWLAFALLAPAAIALIALLSFVAARAMIDPVVLLVQALLTIALYPPLAWLLGRAQRFLLSGV
ncbi:MAG: rod shape-determining protein MreD [Alphaproteobacteria bacterium]|nr:rod shape-determining protein MreD [Alphaproteobacteria bacterium]